MFWSGSKHMTLEEFKLLRYNTMQFSEVDRCYIIKSLWSTKSHKKVLLHESITGICAGGLSHVGLEVHTVVARKSSISGI
jgi:hypothetical protein